MKIKGIILQYRLGYLNDDQYSLILTYIYLSTSYCDQNFKMYA